MARTALTLPATWARGAGKIHIQGRGLGVESQANSNLAQAVGHTIVIQPILSAEITSRHAAQLRPHQALGIIEQLFDQCLQLRFTVLLYQLEHALLADAASSDLRLQVALAFFGGAHVQQNQVQHLAIDSAAAHDSDGRDANAFLENFVGRSHRSSECSSHVRMVGAIRNIEGSLVLPGQKDRQHHGDIRQMRSTGKGIIEDGDVPGRKCNRRDCCLHRHRHGAEMHRHVIAHGDHPRLGIEDGARVVSPFLYVGRESRAPQGCTHLLGNGVHRALKDRQFDGIGSRKAHARSSSAMEMTRLPTPSTCAQQPGGNAVAEVYSVIIAGPWMASPGTRPSRR